MGKAKAGKKVFQSLSKVVKGLDRADAEKVLAKIDTPEKAVALTGDARAEYQNALDVIYGPKDTRMKDMGFGEQDWYHGTTVPIDKFEDSAKGLSTGAQSAKKGFFFAQDPSTASDYAELAREKGIIREGDKVTTRWLSDVPEPIKVGFGEVDNKKMQYFNLLDAPRRESKRLESIKEWEKFKKSPPDWLIQSAKREGKSIEQFIAEKTVRIREKIPLPTEKEINAAKAEYLKTAKEFAATNDPDYVQKIAAIDLDSKNPLSKDYQKAISLGIDTQNSAGQNVLPVKLRPGDGKVHVKDYKGQGYRDTTYSDEMFKAQEKGASGVLFKNTYDPADPNNRVKQNIAAVFEPNQIRSKFAAFDPRFKNSPLLMAGAAGAVMGTTMLPEESEASMGKFNSLKKMWQVGDKAFPAANAAEALKVQKAMETKGMVPHGKVLVEAKGTVPVANKPISNMARGIAVPGALGIDSTGSDVLKSGMQGLSDAFGAYRQHIVEPVTDKLKQKLTPDINVQGKQYQTSSPISDMVIDVGADPLTWTSGGAGDALGILDDIATSSEEESPKRNYEGLKAILNKK